MIQVDEPALREPLPLKKADQPAYLDWSDGAFRLATSGVEASTYAETAEPLTKVVAATRAVRERFAASV